MVFCSSIPWCFSSRKDMLLYGLGLLDFTFFDSSKTFSVFEFFRIGCPVVFKLFHSRYNLQFLGFTLTGCFCSFEKKHTHIIWQKN